MKEKLEEILRRYGNFMSGYDADGDEIDSEEANTQILSLLKEEIEKSLLTDWQIQQAIIPFDLTHECYRATAQAQLDKVLKILT